MEIDMGTMTIRLPDDQHARLKDLAKARGVSLNKLIEEFSIRATAEFDAMTHFQIRAARGDANRGLELLRKLDNAEGANGRGGETNARLNRGHGKTSP
jgi:predicted transcriptional regulator